MQSPPENESKKKPTWGPKQAARRPVKANIGRLRNSCLTILKREVNKLMDLSYKPDSLDAAQGKLMLEYLKYLTELKAIEDLEKLEGK